MPKIEIPQRVPRPEKVQEVASLQEKIGRSRLMIFTNYTGLPMDQLTALRRELLKFGAEYLVVKKTLFERALGDSKGCLPDGALEGPLAVLFATGADEVSPAKTLVKFVKQNERPVIHGGLLENAFAKPADIQALAKLPSKEVLLAQVVGTLNAPIQGFVNVLAGTIRQLVTVMKAVEDQKAKGGA